MTDTLVLGAAQGGSGRGQGAMSGALSPFRGLRSPVQPVSRVWFELSDKDAFERCVSLSVDWMAGAPTKGGAPRSGVQLPKEAWKGEPFDVTDDLGANPSKAVRLDAGDGVLWAARLDWPDPDHPRSWVSEFFAERRLGRMVRYGAQLTCVRRGECPGFDTTRPSVIQRVLESLSAEADHRPLADRIDPLAKRDVADLVELLYREDRRLPVVVLTEDENGRTELIPDALARRVGGAAHIVNMTADATWELTRLVGKRMSVFSGAVRLYQPGLSELDEDPFDHPLWLRGSQARDGLMRQLANRVLSGAFLHRSDPFPRYVTVREAITRQTLQAGAKAREQDGQADELALALSQAAELTEERDEWQSLAVEEQDRRFAAEKDVERLKAEVARLEAKARMFEYRAGLTQGVAFEAEADRPLLSYDDLEDWAEEVLGEGVYLHQAALKDCRKNGHANMLARIQAALLIMRDHMTPGRAKNDPAQREIARKKLAELGIEDTACFVDRDEARHRPQYSVRYEGETRILYDHLKYGNGWDNANQIRIYYFWDADRARYVVGKMPSHLPNNLTN